MGTAIEQGGFQLFDKQALATHFGQRTIQNLIATGSHFQQGHLALRVQLLQTVAYMLGLPQGQLTGTSGNHQFLRSRSHSGHAAK